MKVVYGDSYCGFYLPKEFLNTLSATAFGAIWEVETFEMFTHPALIKMVEDDAYTKRNGHKLYVATIPDEVTDMWVEHCDNCNVFYCVLNGKRVLLLDIISI